MFCAGSKLRIVSVRNESLTLRDAVTNLKDNIHRVDLGAAHGCIYKLINILLFKLFFVFAGSIAHTFRLGDFLVEFCCLGPKSQLLDAYLLLLA